MERKRRQVLKSLGIVTGASAITVSGLVGPAWAAPSAGRGKVAPYDGSPVEPLPRAQHAACLLPGNLVLMIGGVGVGGTLASCQIYDVDRDVWYDAAPLPRPRGLHTATPMPGGRIVVLGGYDAAPLALASIYDPVHDQWAPGTPLLTPRYQHTAEQLPDGRIVLNGGYSTGLLAATELYVP
jgi:hypothetical protein